VVYASAPAHEEVQGAAAAAEAPAAPVEARLPERQETDEPEVEPSAPEVLEEAVGEPVPGGPPPAEDPVPHAAEAELPDYGDFTP
jgi:hypothetical protein